MCTYGSHMANMTLCGWRYGSHMANMTLFGWRDCLSLNEVGLRERAIDLRGVLLRGERYSLSQSWAALAVY